MDIVAEGVGVTGAQGPLLAPTSLRIRDGQLLLVTGDPNSGCTALALTLSGRLRPTRGTVRIDGAADPSALRRKVAVVDAPQITEPEPAVPVRAAVAEGLTLLGRPSRRSAVRTWLADQGLQQHSHDRFENLPAPDRTRLLLRLAAEDRTAEALILDSPDRHGGDPQDWYSCARPEAERGKAVVVLCSPYSAERLGVTPARIGADNRAEDHSTTPIPSTTDNGMDHREGTV